MRIALLRKIAESTLIENGNPIKTKLSYSFVRNYGIQPEVKKKSEKFIHPYKNLHPWKSEKEFSKAMLDSVIYNKDGIVIINKPYGISNKLQDISNHPKWTPVPGLPKAVHYTLEDALPHISKELGYSSLMIVKSPEKYISGIAILAHNSKQENRIKTSIQRARSMKSSASTYWVVTTRSPNVDNGQLRLAITKQQSPCGTYKQPVILDTWANNEVKRGNVKVFNVEHRTIAHSTNNTAALVEIRCSMTKWHVIRVFTATTLLSPILGDNIHGSRARPVMGVFLKISPFSDAAKEMPKLKKDFLAKLQINASQEVIIPAHIHLKEMWLPGFLSQNEDLTVTAPFPPSFQWTCEQLEFAMSTALVNVPPDTEGAL